MSTSAVFATDGFSAVLVLDDAGKIVGGGGYGPGYDGAFRVFEFQNPKDDGSFEAVQPSGKSGAQDWPQKEPYDKAPVGSVTLKMSADSKSLDIEYSFKRAALGGKDDGFSPPPPEEVTGTATLARLA